jgi:hypothetical protein
MHSERPDKLLAERLADILPEGSAFGEDAVWEKLNISLHQKRRKTPVFVLRTAAALLLLPAAWWLLRNGKPEPVERPVVRTQQPERSIAVQAGNGQDKSTAVFRKPVQKHEKTKRTVPTPVPQDVAFPGSPIEIRPAIMDTSVKTEERINAAAVTASAPPRRFRIAHINDNAAPPVTEAAPDEKPSYTFALARRQAGPSPDTETPSSQEHKSRSFLSLKKNH